MNLWLLFCFSPNNKPQNLSVLVSQYLKKSYFFGDTFFSSGTITFFL